MYYTLYFFTIFIDESYHFQYCLFIMCKLLGVLMRLNQKLFMKHQLRKRFYNLLFSYLSHFYDVLLKLTRTVVIYRNYRVQYNNESFTQIFCRILFAKNENDLMHSPTVQNSTMILQPTLHAFIAITHAQRNISFAASRANDMPVNDG